MNPARASWQGALCLLLSLLCTACFSAREVSSLGTYDRPEAGRPDDDDLINEPTGAQDPAAGATPPVTELEDASRPPAREPARDADVLRCGAAGCIGTLPGISEERHCFDVRARNVTSEAPYQLAPSSVQEFVTITTRVPDPSVRTIREIVPIIDNSALVHHMRLYKHRAALPQGVAVGNAPESTMTFLYAWKPGERILFTFEDAAGIPIDGNDLLTLEIHYQRPSPNRPANTRDASGMRICSIRDGVQLPLSFARLAAPEGSGRDEGRCTPALKEPVQLLGIIPTPIREGGGVALEMSVQRRSGERVSIYSTPLANIAEDLTAFYLPAPLLYPGDTIVWDCTYADGASGPYEPCTLQLLHAPGGAIDNACRAEPGGSAAPVLR